MVFSFSPKEKEDVRAATLGSGFILLNDRDNQVRNYGIPNFLFYWTVHYLPLV